MTIRNILAQLLLLMILSSLSIALQAQKLERISTDKEKPELTTYQSDLSGNFTLTVTPTEVTLTTGRSITLTLSVYNRSETPLTNIEINSSGFPAGMEAFMLADDCTLESETIHCIANSVEPNVPMVRSLSLIAPATLPVTLEPISFELTASELSAPIVEQLNLTSSSGSPKVIAVSVSVRVGDIHNTGIFQAQNSNNNMEFVRETEIPQYGAFLWHSSICGDQLYCDDGNFTYIPNSGSEGKIELLAFSVRDKTTLVKSEPAIYSITILASDRDSRAIMNFWFLFIALQMVVIYRKFCKQLQ